VAIMILEPELDPRVNDHVQDQQEVVKAVSLGGRSPDL